MAKIMVAEPYEPIRNLLKAVLTSIGHEVVAEVSYGSDALSAFQVFMPEMVSLDLRLPYTDGFELVRLIKTSYPHTKIIAYSSGIHSSEIELAMSYGAEVVFDKPFDIEEYLRCFKDV